MIEPRTLKGFRDFLPKEAKKRQYVINILRKVFESYGFEPLETPALEYEDILLGKYGEEGDKLMYRFTDRGGRKVALRYDQTVPLARVVAQYGNQLPTPFKRYQIQPVWRAENPQKGRFREFLQCDIDIVDTNSPLADAEVIACVAKGLESLGFKNFKILINDRFIFNSGEFLTLGESELGPFMRSLDKIKKIGADQALEEMVSFNIPREQAEKIINSVENQKITPNLQKIMDLLNKYNITNIEFDPMLVRGLDYYTGLIFEVVIPEYGEDKSIGGGGRYDSLIGMFAGKQISAVGFAFGFDRIIESMDQLNLFPKDLITTKVLVTIFSQDLAEKSLAITEKLRSQGINTDLWPDPESKLEKQLKYADQKGIPFVVIAGPDEISQNKITIKDMSQKTQKTVSVDDLPDAFKF